MIIVGGCSCKCAWIESAMARRVGFICDIVESLFEINEGLRCLIPNDASLDADLRRERNFAPVEIEDLVAALGG